MVQRIQAPDGTIVEFPDEMTDAQIAAAMRKEYGGPRTRQGSNTGIGFVDRANNRRLSEYERMRRQGAENRAARARGDNPIFQVGKDFFAPLNAAVAGLKRNYSASVNQGPARSLGDVVEREKRGLSTLGHTAGLLTFPVVGAVEAGLIKPVSRAVEQIGIGDETANSNILSTGLMALGARGGAPASRPALAPRSPAAGVIAREVPDAGLLRAEGQRMRQAGVEPTLTDAVGERGRRLVRAVGVKVPEAGEVLQNRSRVVTSTAKPAVMARTRQLSGEQRSAQQVLDDLIERRDTAASTDYREAYGQTINITPETVSALRGRAGEAAIRRAIRAADARRDGNLYRELNRLLEATRRQDLPGQQPVTPYNTMRAAEPPLEPVSGAALDRVQIALRKTAENMDANQAGDIASGLYGRQASINRDLDAFEGLAPARESYRNTTRAIEILQPGARNQRLDVFSTDPGDYARWLQSLPEEAVHANRVAIRQEILDTLGGQRSNTFGSLDELATSEYARANLRQALGPDAEPYLANLEARLAQVRNASFVSPNAGSRTGVLESDTKGLSGLISVGTKIARQDYIGLAQDWLRTRGIADDVAVEIASLASDPARFDEAVRLIERALGPGPASEFLARVGRYAPQAVAGSTATAPSTPVQ